MEKLRIVKTRTFWSDPFLPNYAHGIRFLYDDDGLAAIQLLHEQDTPRYLSLQIMILSEYHIEQVGEYTDITFICTFPVCGNVQKKTIQATFQKGVVSVFPSDVQNWYYVATHTLIFHEDLFRLYIIESDYPACTAPLVFYEWEDDIQFTVHDTQLDIMACMLRPDFELSNGMFTLRQALHHFFTQYKVKNVTDFFEYIAKTSGLNVPYELRKKVVSDDKKLLTAKYITCKEDVQNTFPLSQSSVKSLSSSVKGVTFEENRLMSGSNGMYINHKIITQPGSNTGLAVPPKDSSDSSSLVTVNKDRRKKTDYLLLRVSDPSNSYCESYDDCVNVRKPSFWKRVKNKLKRWS